MLNEYVLSIIDLSETRLDKAVSDSEVIISGYDSFRNGRDLSNGVAAICVKASLHEPTVRIKRKNLEWISLEIAPRHAKPFLVVRWHKPPTADDAAFSITLGKVRKI